MALSWASKGAEVSSSSLTHLNHLDGGYMIFAQDMEGTEVVNRIARGDKIERIENVEPK